MATPGIRCAVGIGLIIIDVMRLPLAVSGLRFMVLVPVLRTVFAIKKVG
jgi:hypothetical protein